MGLEKTPEEFVANMVAVFREVRRVLRDDGTLWLNIGDSYAASERGQGGPSEKQESSKGTRFVPQKFSHGLKPKDLCGIPWRLAFALQADGWWLRSEIIWAKPNPMPESVTDRPTKAHEQIFLLTKAERYFYDQEAVREPHHESTVIRREIIEGASGTGRPRYSADGMAACPSGVTGAHPNGRNLRTVWTIPTQPYPGSHFATFPEELAERCIKAGTSERGACSQCGRPWVRITEPTPEYAATLEKARNGADWFERADKPEGNEKRYVNGGKQVSTSAAYKTTGWEQLCGCGAAIAPCLVLDPFFGSGTVGRVCRHLRRNCIGIDLNADYLGNQARARVSAPLDRDVAKQAESIPGQKTMF